MPYVEGRVVHDADAHIMEWPTWLVDYAEPGGPGAAAAPHARRRLGRALDLERVREKHASAEYRADEAAEIMSRKNFAATGSFIAEDRPRALDLLGFASQLIFNTFHNGRFAALEQSRPRARLRRRPRPQPGDGRVLLGRPSPAAHLLRAAGRLRPGEGHGRRGGGGRRGGAAGAVGLPEGALAEPHRPRPGVGDRRRRRACRSCSTSAGESRCSTRTTSRTACRSRRTSTAARRTSDRSATWPSRGRRSRRWPR